MSPARKLASRSFESIRDNIAANQAMEPTAFPIGSATPVAPGHVLLAFDSQLPDGGGASSSSLGVFDSFQRRFRNEEVPSSRDPDYRKKRGRSASEALENLCEWLQRKSLPHRMDQVRTRCAVSGARQDPSACGL